MKLERRRKKVRNEDALRTSHNTYNDRIRMQGKNRASAGHMMQNKNLVRRKKRRVRNARRTEIAHLITDTMIALQAKIESEECKGRAGKRWAHDAK